MLFKDVCVCLVTQSCLTICDPRDCNPPGSSVCEILQVRTLEWVAMPSSRGPSQPRDRTQVFCNVGWFFPLWVTREAHESIEESSDKCHKTEGFYRKEGGGKEFSSDQLLSRVWLFVTPWTAARQASLSITNSWSLPKPMSTESVMQSNHFILCCPLLLLPSIFLSIRVFSNESALRIRWPKYFSFNIIRKREWSHSSCVRLFATPWAVAYQAPPSMGFSRQEHRSGLPFPSSGDLPKGRDLPFFRDQTGVSHVPGRRFSLWATREGPQHYWESDNSTLVWICWLCFSCWWISSSNLQFLIVNWFPLICYL